MSKILNGAKALILSPDKILLFHRDNIPTIRSPDCWQLVGGGIEDGETPEEGMLREVREEASYNLTDYKLITKVKGAQGEDVYLFVSFIDKEEESKFKLGPGEGQDLGWFTLTEATKLKLTDSVKDLFLGQNRKLLEFMMKTRQVPVVDSSHIQSD
jgi:8-oxo-dGTP diphosphatase